MANLLVVRQRLKSRLKALRQEWFRRRFAFDVAKLEAELSRLGVKAGDTLLVHSSFEKLLGFQGTASDVIKTLQACVGPEGTLLMPTLPFSGSALDYVKELGVFDARRAPSRMGLLTELFRRTRGVERSLHPTHPVAVWGRRTEFMVKDHHASPTPCGRHTPYGRLLDCDGKVLLLGTSIRTLTFYHCVEELLESEFPESPFTKEEFVLKSRDAAGNIYETRTRLFDPALSKRRNLSLLEQRLRQQGSWRQGHIGRAGLILLEAKQVLDAVTSMSHEGIFCYDER